MSAVLLCLSLAASLLCKFTIRDVGFVFVGDPLVQAVDGNQVERYDGVRFTLPPTSTVDGGIARRALAQELLSATAVVLVLPGAEQETILASAKAAADDLEAMSRQGRLARALTLPVQIHVLDTAADPVAAFAMGWQQGGPAGTAVLYGRGRLAGSTLFGAFADRQALLEQLTLVADSCECDRPREWLHTRHLDLPWDRAMRRRAMDALGFDPHSPSIEAEMKRILQRGPRGLVDDIDSTRFRSDPVIGYDEIVMPPLASDAQQSGKPLEEPRRFGSGLFWLCVGLGIVVLVGVAIHVMSSEAA